MRVSGMEVLPDSARVWIFGCEGELDGAGAETLLSTVDGFLDTWAAHGVPLRAARSWVYDRFLIVAVDEESAPPSGCSIDALVHVLEGLEQAEGVRFLGNETVWYRDDQGTVQSASRAQFRTLAQSGAVAPTSVVFDNTVTSLAQLREGQWEGPAADRWQAAFFR